MTHQLNVGDRVRVRINTSVPGHPPGDKGSVVVGPVLRPTGEPYYFVKMDKGDDTNQAIFSADEIEPDV